MSGTVADNLSQEKIQQLLAAVGSVPRSDTSGDEAADYDWRKPQYFSIDQRAKLGEFAEKAARECVDEFSRLYHGLTGVSVVFAAQYFQNPSETANAPAEYCFAFGTDPQKPFGLMRIPESSAALWTGHALGGGDEPTEDSGRSFSKLEESFLTEIASVLIKDFSRAYGSPLQLDRGVLREPSFAALQGSQELFMIGLEVRKADSENAAARVDLLMCCDKLQSVAGKLSDEGKTATADNIRAMREHLKEVPVSLTVRLARTTLRFKDILDLRVGDIMLLGKKVSDPVEVLIGGKTVFQGRPAQSGGKQAVVIV